MDDKVHVALIVSEFNSEITQLMLNSAKRYAESSGAKVTYICKVPGAFDMPLFIKLLLKRQKVDAVVTLGAIVQGETQHDQIIAQQVAAKITDLSLQYEKPVTLGISGPGMTMDQGLARADEFSRRSVEAAIKMVNSSRRIRATKGKNQTIMVD
jgi:6,7-dimethyl-8-ribityllumazine synthase|tara:strand:+ start:11714 stop:12175 length:462 start_codon:yes stop_codon:yes gene_type:complete